MSGSVVNGEVCGDNRFELIAKYRAMLLESTNIEDSPEEMAVIDTVLFRCWQMGWLERLEESESYVTAPPLEDQLLEALNENEKLKDYGARLFDKTLELGADNAKLREIARAAWTCINVKNCSECRFISGGCTLYTAMCEMGIGTGE